MVTRRIVETSIHRRVLVVLIFAGLLAFAIAEFDRLKVDTLPEFQPPIVEVQTEALGLSAAEVEQLITVPLEADLLNGVAWLESIRSSSIPGLSSIVMQFEPGTDILEARQVVQERLTQAHGLPNVSRAPAMIQPLSAESRVMMIGLRSDEVSLIDMSVLARWTVRPFLMGVPGVANVSVWGQRERQLQVQADPGQLASRDLTLLDVVKTTGNALWVSPLTYLESSTPGTGGFIDGPNQRIGIQHALGIAEAEDLAGVAVEGHEDLTLGEVTTVVEDHQPLIGDALVKDNPGLIIVVERFPWANTVETTQAVEDALEELAPGLAGIEVDPEIFRPASYLERSIANVRNVSIASLLLVTIAAFTLLSGWRTAVVALSTIVVSLAAAGVVLVATGTEVDTMVLAGLVVGLALVIADSVGDADTLRRRLSGPEGGSALATITDTLASTRRLAGYVLVTVALAIVPSFAMAGAAGAFLPDVGIAMIIAVVVSVVVAVTLTPALAGFLLVRDAPSGESWTMRRLRAGHERLTAGRRSGAVMPAVVASVVLLALGAAATPFLVRDYIPAFHQTDLVIDVNGVPGKSLEASRRLVASTAEEIRQIPGVTEVGAHVGRALLSDEVVNVNNSELWVKIDPGAAYGPTVQAVQAVLAGYPGYATPRATSYSNQQVSSVLQESDEELVLRVFGEDPAVLGEVADGLVGAVGDLPGTENVRVRHPLLEPAIEIEVDLDRAAQHGVKPGDVRRTAATLLSGIEVGSFFEEQKVFEVVVWSPPENRQSVTNVERLLVNTPFGGLVPLSEVADVRVAPVQNVIQRDGVSRYIDIVGDLSGSPAEVEQAITDLIRERGLPYEYYARVISGTTPAAGQLPLIAVTAAVAIAILLIVQAAFDSWRLAFLLLISSALSVAGGLVAIVLTGRVFSIGSSIGLFAAWAVTLRLGFMLVGRYEELRRASGTARAPQLIRDGLADRFAPTVASLVTILLAMVPIAVVGSIAGTEVIAPLAAALIGGLIASAVITLFVLPLAYDRFVNRPVQNDLQEATR